VISGEAAPRTRAGRRWLAAGAATATLWCAAAALAAGQAPPPGAAWLVRPLDAQGPRREARGDILDTPVLPGSIVKAVALVAALEAGAITGRSSHLCRRVVTVDGHTYTCAHPVLKRALTPAEALAYSCNDFFLSLAPRLSRDAVNAVRGRAGLAPIPPSTPLAAALLGLDGPRVTPRALVDVMARLTGTAPAAPVPMRAATRRVLLEGLRGAAEYGTAAAFGERRVAALAKTGTAPMPGGGTMGLVVALAPAAAPTRGVVVVAPGAAGLDAAAVAADLLRPSGGGASLGPPAGRTEAPSLRVGRLRTDAAVRVETFDLDRYVSEVVAGEAHRDSGDAALAALAIAVRTYALGNRGRHAAEGFDLCDTTHCQVLRPATALTRRAAQATSGRVLLAGDRVASVYHSAWCGGHPERPSEVWPGATDHGAASGRDDACAGEPGWTSEIRAADLEEALTAAGLRGGPLRDVRVVGRNRTGRVTRVRIEGWAPAELSGQEFRTSIGRHLGWQHVKSTLFELQRTAAGYRISGRGFGHGAGLCVLGATRRAARGATAEAILSFYFPGLTVGAAPAAGAGEVRLALPGEESSERAALLALLRRSRDEIARAAGVDGGSGLRVTVHPTVESFGRATGQPWYVAGATRGANIDLLPLTVLRRNGQLERVVRHEVAHVLIDAHLEGRPLWVREGAAAHFSAERARPRPLNGESRLRAALPCPTDAELRRPAGAAAQRDAYDRAHACFAGQVAAGTPWRDVR
jgi:stage II sporulation protein D